MKYSMTEYEAKAILDVRISRFDHADDVNEALKVAKYALGEIRQYRALGTVEELREAMEKQIPRKPVEESCVEHTNYKCECGYIFCIKYSDGCRIGNTPDYCEKCGQAIDWSDEE